MILDVDRFGTDDDPAEVMTRLVTVARIQQWMLVLDEHTGEVHPVVAAPEAYQQEDTYGRYERWMRLPMHEADPMDLVAATRVPVVFGTPVDELAPMPPEDMLTVEDEALATNGMCHARIEPDLGDEHHEEEPDTVWCGRPSDPASPMRFCTGHHSERLADNFEVTARGYEPIYG